MYPSVQKISKSLLQKTVFLFLYCTFTPSTSHLPTHQVTTSGTILTYGTSTNWKFEIKLKRLAREIYISAKHHRI